MSFKRILILAFLLFLSVSLFATQTMSVTWEWGDRDPEVQYYRYQVDGEDEDGWTVVSYRVMDYKATGLDPYEDHTLYLQSSYDGLTWSDSAVSVAPAMLYSRKNADDYTSDGNLISEVEGENLDGSPITRKPKEAKFVYGYVTNFLLSAGAANFIPAIVPTEAGWNLFGVPYTRYGFGIDFQNIYHAGPFGLGLRTDLSCVVMPIAGDWANTPEMKNFFNPQSWWYDSSIDIKAMIYLGNRYFDFYLGGGIGYTLLNQQIKDEATEKQFGHSLGNWGIFSSGYYIPANIGFRGRFNSTVSLGMDIDFRYMLPAQAMSLSTSITLGFSV